jgi:hypothetical protein
MKKCRLTLSEFHHGENENSDEKWRQRLAHDEKSLYE